MNISKRSGLLLLAGLLTPACALWGVEPEEIDLANEETAAEEGFSAGSNSEGGDGDGDNELDEETADAGDGDGDDPTTAGDGDGDPGDGDGDGEPGDGDGDGESTDTGDGDGEVPCQMYDPIVVSETDNAIDIPNEMSLLVGSCGSPGPEAVFSFTATSDASYEFTLSSDAFEGVFYLVGGICDPLDEIACEPEGQAIIHEMLMGEVVYIVVDSDAGPGAATLSIVAI